MGAEEKKAERKKKKERKREREREIVVYVRSAQGLSTVVGCHLHKIQKVPTLTFKLFDWQMVP